MSKACTAVTAESARHLLLSGVGLCADPARRSTPAALRQRIEDMGYVQVDTISIVTRAHHHVLMTRFDDYRPPRLRRLLERDRHLFEHWTHDASFIPTAWLGWWKRRFLQYRRRRPDFNKWWAERMGERPDRVIRAVTRRVDRDGEVRSRDFETARDERGGAWWSWSPHKAALEYLWRAGTLAVSRRDGFDKVYARAERIYPQLQELETPPRAAYVDWACATALERLGVATPGELAEFFGGVAAAEARAWCHKSVRRRRAVDVKRESLGDASPTAAVALPDWQQRAGRVKTLPRLRLLSPFDPAIRDRRRALRLFGFDYRFEAFVPAARRRFGYYVLPLLDGERFIGRVDAKFHRDRGELQVLGHWWEPGVRATAARKRRFDAALVGFTEQLRQLGGQ